MLGIKDVFSYLCLDLISSEFKKLYRQTLLNNLLKSIFLKIYFITGYSYGFKNAVFVEFLDELNRLGFSEREIGLDVA